ncbi:hypothetical protein BJX96DRAFT_142994 [Aspergillus floccosus]
MSGIVVTPFTYLSQIWQSLSLQRNSDSSGLPLPPEIVRDILTYVNCPSTELPHSDLKACRLTCKQFAAIGISFLVEDLYFFANPRQLRPVGLVSKHPIHASNVRRLIYDGSPYRPDSPDWEEIEDPRFVNGHVKECPLCSPCLQAIFLGSLDRSKKEHDGKCQGYHMRKHMSFYYLWYRIIPMARYDYDTLVTALPRFPGLRHVVYKASCPRRWMKPHAIIDPPPLRCSLREAGYEPSDHHDLMNFLEAIADSGVVVDSLEITVDIHFLRTLARALTDKLDKIQSAFTRLQSLKLFFITPYSGDAIPDYLENGIMGKLLGKAKRLTTLKLSYGAKTSNKSQPDISYRLGLPLEAYIGSVSFSSSDSRPEPSFPHLEALLLGNLSTTELELVSFLSAHPTLQTIEFDGVVLAGGQWANVGISATVLPNWHTLKCRRLRQDDPLDVTGAEWINIAESLPGLDPSTIFPVNHPYPRVTRRPISEHTQVEAQGR